MYPRSSTHPRRSDCPGGFHSDVSRRTDRTSSLRLRTTKVTNFTHPTRQLPWQLCFWMQPPISFHGSKPYLSFALFTTLPGRVRLSQDIRRLCGKYIVAHQSRPRRTGFSTQISDKLDEAAN